MRLRIVTAVLTACTLPACVLPGAAHAHAILLDSQPAARGVAAPGPARITLRFNSRIDQARSRLVLRRDGADQTLALQPTGAEDVLAAQATLAPGSYVLRWQVLAVDGHITRGDVPFMVRPGPVAQAPAAPSLAASSPAAVAPVAEAPVAVAPVAVAPAAAP